MTWVASLTPTVTGDTAAYASGDNVGGKLTLADFARTTVKFGQVIGARIVSDSLQTCFFDLVLFSADPSGSTFTNNAAQDIVAADQAKIMGVIHLNDVTALSGCSIHQAIGQAMEFLLPSGLGVTAYAAIVVRGTPTLAANGDLSLELRVRLD